MTAANKPVRKDLITLVCITVINLSAIDLKWPHPISTWTGFGPEASPANYLFMSATCAAERHRQTGLSL
ncbi:hypothetical protein hamaS1_17980 [Moorella sp. Hama-1]|nr:hypothetical protein hamaS1_17980 [Moorella sp. Hama-1]